MQQMRQDRVAGILRASTQRRQGQLRSTSARRLLAGGGQPGRSGPRPKAATDRSSDEPQPTEVQELQQAAQRASEVAKPGAAPGGPAETGVHDGDEAGGVIPEELLPAAPGAAAGEPSCAGAAAASGLPAGPAGRQRGNGAEGRDPYRWAPPQPSPWNTWKQMG